MSKQRNNRENSQETYSGPSKSGNNKGRSAQPGNPAYDKKLDGPNRPSV